MQLPDRIIVYELSGDDPTDMRYRVKVRGKGGGGGLAFLRAKLSDFANLPQSVVKLGFFQIEDENEAC